MKELNELTNLIINLFFVIRQLIKIKQQSIWVMIGKYSMQKIIKLEQEKEALKLKIDNFKSKKS
jgi:hypothetical protein